MRRNCGRWGFYEKARAFRPDGHLLTAPKKYKVSSSIVSPGRNSMNMARAAGLAGLYTSFFSGPRSRTIRVTLASTTFHASAN